MSVDPVLHAKARELIRSGSVPDRLPNRRWCGPGIGTPCMLCGKPVENHEIDVEIELTSDGDGKATNLHFHLRCLTVLEHKLREIELARYAGPDNGNTQSTAAASGAAGPGDAASA